VNPGWGTSLLTFKDYSGEERKRSRHRDSRSLATATHSHGTRQNHSQLGRKAKDGQALEGGRDQMASSTKRSKKFVGRVMHVACYPYRNENPLYGIADLMRAMPGIPIASGQFFFDGSDVHFHETDEKIEKVIVYESIEHVQRTARGKKVRLQP
jgi:hypothetical protein